jgi:hypothetical protein
LQAKGFLFAAIREKPIGLSPSGLAINLYHLFQRIDGAGHIEQNQPEFGILAGDDGQNGFFPD